MSPRRIGLRPGVLVLLAALAPLVAPQFGVRVHHHLGGQHAHVHPEDVGRHGHHGHDHAHPHRHAHAHDGTDALAAGRVVEAPDLQPPVQGPGPAGALLSTPEVAGHLHAFDPFLRGLRAAAVRLAAPLGAAIIPAPVFAEVPRLSPVVALARGPPAHPPF